MKRRVELLRKEGVELEVNCNVGVDSDAGDLLKILIGNSGNWEYNAT